MIKATFGTGMFNRSKHADALFLFFHPYILLVAESNDRVKSGNILLYHLRTTCEAVLKNGMKLDEFNIFIYHIEDNDKRFKKKTIKDFKKLAEKSIITLFKEFCKRPHTKQECITESNNNGTQMRGQKNNDEVEQQENEEKKEKIESWRKSRAERALRNTVLAEINRGNSISSESSSNNLVPSEKSRKESLDVFKDVRRSKSSSKSPGYSAKRSHVSLRVFKEESISPERPKSLKATAPIDKTVPCSLLRGSDAHMKLLSPLNLNQELIQNPTFEMKRTTPPSLNNKSLTPKEGVVNTLESPSSRQRELSCIQTQTDLNISNSTLVRLGQSLSPEQEPLFGEAGPRISRLSLALEIMSCLPLAAKLETR